jgi:hypothetical protein
MLDRGHEVWIAGGSKEAASVDAWITEPGAGRLGCLRAVAETLDTTGRSVAPATVPTSAVTSRMCLLRRCPSSPSTPAVILYTQQSKREWDDADTGRNTKREVMYEDRPAVVQTLLVQGAIVVERLVTLLNAWRNGTCHTWYQIAIIPSWRNQVKMAQSFWGDAIILIQIVAIQIEGYNHFDNPGFDRHPISPLRIKWITGWIKWIKGWITWIKDWVKDWVKDWIKWIKDWIKGWIKWIQASRSRSINTQIKLIQVDQDPNQTKSQANLVPHCGYTGWSSR